MVSLAPNELIPIGLSHIMFISMNLQASRNYEI